MGDSSGVGPEVILKSLKEVPDDILENSLLFGESWVMHEALQQLQTNEESSSDLAHKLNQLQIIDFNLLKKGDFKQGRLSKKCGHAAFEYFTQAIQWCKEGKADAIVTAPINKEAINLAGHTFLGHTDILEKVLKTPTLMTLFHHQLIVAHVTDHIPLSQVIQNITPQRLSYVIELTTHAARSLLGREPRVAVAGINPHAGENGILGKEEITTIIPTLKALEKKGFPTIGPLPGDTIFYEALKGNYDVVIAMYHDQGFGPMKTVGFSDGVNCTLGLPFTRTSPDHGTAFNIVGKGIADSRSFLNAWLLASKLRR